MDEAWFGCGFLVFAMMCVWVFLVVRIDCLWCSVDLLVGEMNGYSVFTFIEATTRCSYTLLIFQYRRYIRCPIQDFIYIHSLK